MYRIKYVTQFVIFVAVLCGMRQEVFAQQPTPAGAPPRLTTATPRPSATPVQQRIITRRRPTKELLQQKWPAVPRVVDIPVVIDTNEADLRAKFEKAKLLLADRKPQLALPILLEAERSAPERFEIQLILGVCLAVLGRFDEASRSFKKAVVLAPKNAEARFGLCQTLADTSRTLEAIDECREAVRLAPKQENFRQALANVYLNNEQFNEAAALLEALLASQNDLVSSGLLGDAYFLSGEYYKALDVYERIARVWPQASLAQYRLSRVYDYMERPTESIAAARRFVEMEPKLIESHLNLGERLQLTGFFHESIEALGKAVALDPNSGYAALLLSESYSIIGDHDNALPNLKIAYRRLPPNADLALRFGKALMDNGSVAEAVEALELANKSEPDQPDIMRPLGLAYIAVGRQDDGKTLIERANQISPLPAGLSMTFQSAAEMNQQIERFDETLAFVQKNPKHVDARRYLVRLYKLKKMPIEAEKQYLELIKLVPDDFAIYNDLAVFYAESNQREKAIEAIRNAIRLKPHHVFYMTLSWELRRLGKLDEATDAAAKAVEIKPDSLESRLTYGELLLKKGLRTDALREYQAAFQAASGDRRPNFRLAWLYIQMGNKDGAFRHYAILKSIAPTEVKWLELSLRAHYGTLP